MFSVLSEEGGDALDRNIALPWGSNTTSQPLSLLPLVLIMRGFPGGAVVKNLPASAGDPRNAGLIPGSGRSPGLGNGNPLQHSYLENSMDREAWRATVHGVAKS